MTHRRGRPLAGRLLTLVVLVTLCALGRPITTNAASAPDAGPNLARPTFTATGMLTAQLVRPAAGEVGDDAKTTFEVSTTAGAGVELAVNAAVVPFAQIGKRTVSADGGATHYFYYGVALRPGPNDVSLTALGANEARGSPAHAVVFGRGPATRVTLSVAGPLRADGRSANIVTIAAIDAWEHPALAGLTFHVSISPGDARIEALPDPSAAPTAAGDRSAAQTLDVPNAAGGSVAVRLVPGLVPGDIELHATCGELTAVARLVLAPSLRRPLVTGIVTAGVGSVPADPAAATGVPDGVNARRGRIAVYATGAVDASTLATVAYDTAHRLQQDSTTGTFVDDPNERPYATYGDASIRHADALSRDHLFLRVDRGRSSFTWGEFNAVTAPTTDTLGGYSALVDGARVELAGQAGTLSAFAAKNNVAFDRRVFAPSGLAAPAQQLFANIVVGSEAVTLVALDRRTGAVVNQSVLAPNVDYALDAASGAFRFITIPLPFDDSGNPQQIVLTYEYAGTATRSGTIGGRIEHVLGNRITVGAGYVNDTDGAGNFTLASANIGGPLKNGNWSIANVASRGTLGFSQTAAAAAPTHGEALHATLTLAAGAQTLSAGINDTTAGFSNPFGGLATPGLLDARVALTHHLADGRGDIAITLERQANAGIGSANRQAQAALRVHRVVSKRFAFTLGLGAQRVHGDVSAGPRPTAQRDTANGTTGLATLAASYTVGTRISIDASRVQTLGGPLIASQPDQTQLQIAYRLDGGGHAYLRELWSSVPTQSFAASTVGLTAAAATTRSIEFGVERSLSPALSADSEYLIERTGSGTDLYAAMGVRERLTLSPALTGDAYLQRADAAGAAANGFTAYGASLHFSGAGNAFQSSASLQARTGSANGMTLSLAAAGTIARNLALFASLASSRGAAAFADSARVGIAWRPADSDREITLAQFERSSGTFTASTTQTGVLSVEELYRPATRLELVARYAYKVDGDTFYAAHTSLIGLRIDRRLGARFDVGLEGRTTCAHAIDGAANLGASAELGVRAGASVRIAAGYNLARSGDPALTQLPASGGMYLTVTSVVDRLFGWGRER